MGSNVPEDETGRPWFGRFDRRLDETRALLTLCVVHKHDLSFREAKVPLEIRQNDIKGLLLAERKGTVERGGSAEFSNTFLNDGVSISRCKA